MITSLQALLVVLLAVLPGALYVYAFERQAGRWGIGVSDRLLRFIGFSAVLHSFAAPASYELYRQALRSRAIAEGRALPTWVWVLVLAYVFTPLLLGTVVGRATRAGRPWATWFTGPSPAPRSYDHLFGTGSRDGWVRLKIKDGPWILGAFAREDEGLRSYASGYPHPEQLFLADTAECDDHGNFVVDEHGHVRLRGIGVLVGLHETAYLEWIDG